ncbi:MAG: hypothetical protein MZV63_72140 [Marinilabiliales bacterium]|nr:hypothetical protein [Marinilabiliales bacterium]
MPLISRNSPPTWKSKPLPSFWRQVIKPLPTDAKKEYGGGKLRNVVGRHDGGAPAGSHRGLWPPTAPIGWQAARYHRLCPVRRFARPDVWVCDYCSRVCCMYAIKQAMLAGGRPANGRHHHLLHGHPRLWQRLRAVLPERQSHGRRIRQGQGGPHYRGRGPESHRTRGTD